MGVDIIEKILPGLPLIISRSLLIYALLAICFISVTNTICYN